MIRIIGMFLTGCIVSGYFYPFSLSFLPINTKIILAGIGGLLFLFEGIKKRQLLLSKELFGAAGISILFSIICFFSAEYNNTTDYSYADYFVSFATWVAGAYTVVAAIRMMHGKANLPTLTGYLAAVSAAQCVLALVIDQNAEVKELVDAYVVQGVEFLDRVGRLYGIGASLDSAGVRFSIVLILIAFVLTKDTAVKNSRMHIFLYSLAFFVIGILGNMISRTTTTGLLFALAILFLSSGVYKMIIRADNIKIYSILAVGITVGVVVATYLYRTNPYYYDMLRFAFEGFFNWVETGRWSTGSTDKLDAEMWIWPQDFKTWMIGSGLFGLYIFSTDIGYCRFILYCGLIGFGTFVLFFIYNAYVFARKNHLYKNLFLSLFAFALVVWLKVATDIFLVFALFYWLDDQLTRAEDTDEEIEEEDAEETELIATNAL